MLVIYDITHNKKGPLTNYSDFHIERGQGQLDLLYVTINIDTPEYLSIQREGYIGTENYGEYVIKEINISDGDTTTVQVVADLNVEDLKGYRVDSFAAVEQIAKDSTNLALVGTGWAVGTSNVTRARTVRQTQVSSWDILMEIQSAFNCELEFDTTLKHVNIYQQRGQDRGVYFAEQLNLKQLNAQGSSRDYVTCLIPLGKDKLTIADVNGGQDYISNHQYSNKNIYAYWSDNRYTVAQNLYDDAVERLDYLSKPIISYSAIVIDLANASPDKYGILDYDFGDTITLLANSKGIKDQQRIVKIGIYPDEPEKNTCEIANRIASLDALNVRFIGISDMVDDVTTQDGMVDGSKVEVSSNANLGTLTTQNLNAVLAIIGTAMITKLTVTDLNVINADIQHLQVNKADITDLAATNAQIANLLVDTAMILDASITTAKIADLAVTTAKIVDLAVTNAKIGNLAVGTAQIKIAAITTALIANAAVGTAQIADGSITDAKIVSLTASKISAGTIDAGVINVTNLNAANITVGTINGAQITPGAIGATQLATSINTLISTAQTTADGKNTIYYQATMPTGGTYKTNDLWFDIDDGFKMYSYNGTTFVAFQLGTNAIANASITNALIADGTILNAKIGTLDAGKITTGTLDALRIAAGTITASHIATGTITATQIATNAITAVKILANTITGDKLVIDAITAREIAALSITANEIAAGTITGAKIAADTITAIQIAALTITAAEIAAGTITGAKISSSYIYAGTITAGQIVGGTLSLGGLNNVSGVLTMKDAANVIFGSLDKTGLVMGKPLTIGGNYVYTYDGYTFDTLHKTIVSEDGIYSDDEYPNPGGEYWDRGFSLSPYSGLLLHNDSGGGYSMDWVWDHRAYFGVALGEGSADREGGVTYLGYGNNGGLKILPVTGADAYGTPSFGTPAISIDGNGNVNCLRLSVAGVAVDPKILKTTDNRAVKPTTISTAAIQGYFTSKEGLTGVAGANYQDFLTLSCYTDASGGKVNALSFDKTTLSIYHYQALKTDTTWGIPKTLAYQEDTLSNTVAKLNNNWWTVGSLTMNQLSPGVAGGTQTYLTGTQMSTTTVNYRTLTNSSDAILKDDIRLYDEVVTTKALDMIMATPIYHYKRMDENGREELGFIAQEAPAIMMNQGMFTLAEVKDLTAEEKTDLYNLATQAMEDNVGYTEEAKPIESSINTNQAIMLMWKAIQELNAKIGG